MLPLAEGIIVTSAVTKAWWVLTGAHSGVFEEF